MNKKQFFQYYFPALGFLVLAFAAGSQSHPAFAFLGFISFFTAAVTFWMEGRKDSSSNNPGKKTSHP